MLEFIHIRDPALPGAENMGRDEALLRIATEESRPVLRTYAWSTPTISLGYFQNLSEIERYSGMVREMPVVRRSTGGGAILHDLELTYSLVLPLGHPMIAGRPNHLYALVHRAISEAVGNTIPISTAVGMHKEIDLAERIGAEDCHRAQHGPFFCFARRSDFDVVIDREGGALDKLAGSAQRRGKSTVLQHGSIILASRFDEQPCATWSGCASRNVGFEEATQRFVEALASTIDVTFAQGDWSDEAMAMAAKYREMHASQAWLHNRERIGDFPT